MKIILKFFFMFISMLIFPLSLNPQSVKSVVDIHYLGHSSFILQFDNGITVLTDYGQSYSYGLPSPIYGLGGFKPDIVIYSHKHIDHAGGKIPENIPHILSNMDSLTIKGLKIKPIPTYEQSLAKPDNTSFLFVYKGKKILHLGDAQALIINIDKEEVKSKVKKLYPDKYDLILMPIGYINDIVKPAVKFINLLDTDRIIPIHYWTKKTKQKFLTLLQEQSKNQKKKHYHINKLLSAVYSISDPNKDLNFVEVLSLEPAPFNLNSNKSDEILIKEIFNNYTSAVINRDIQKLMAALTNSTRFHFLTGSGNLINTREEYYKWHLEWFKQQEWDISFEAPLIYAEENMGYTMSVFYYRGKSSEGKTILLESFFTLIFHEENGDWKIISDICTPIKREPK